MSFLDNAGVTKLTSYLKTKIEALISNKQDTLVSGTNIKTVGGYSLLGSGNVSFPTVPSASSTTPLMDGTASSGNETSYARGNHRHPTDTSRQETLVSGTNIKTVNGNSLLGSGDITIQSGGASRLTLYIQRNISGQTLYADSSCTIPFIEECDWDYREAYNRLKSADIVEIRWIESTSAGCDFFCSAIYHDFVDDTITVSSANTNGVMYFYV